MPGRPLSYHVVEARTTLRHWRDSIRYRLDDFRYGLGTEVVTRAIVVAFVFCAVVVVSWGTTGSDDQVSAIQVVADPVEAASPDFGERLRAGSGAIPATAALMVGLDELASWLPSDDPDWVLPLPVVNADRASAGHHDYAAWDYVVPVGTEVYAMVAGTVVEVGASTGTCGGLVRIVDTSGRVELLYCHLSDVTATAGQRVHPGELVGHSGGQVGAPGAGSSRGAHLHLEIRVDDQLRCPQPLMVKLGRSASVDDPPTPFDLPTSGCVSWPSYSSPMFSTQIDRGPAAMCEDHDAEDSVSFGFVSC